MIFDGIVDIGRLDPHVHCRRRQHSRSHVEPAEAAKIVLSLSKGRLDGARKHIVHLRGALQRADDAAAVLGDARVQPRVRHLHAAILLLPRAHARFSSDRRAVDVLRSVKRRL